eukprot:TRINITY_DN11334_c0_g2_i1.p1 TRINITY_DN11334_c0_g2~~TRINITY_DN11334_c0_g2_i1.p1  ORF type:complete len:639 (-),score=189.79 TRINITY_DN11334_c0_g2_i1:195-2111(-)
MSAADANKPRAQAAGAAGKDDKTKGAPVEELEDESGGEEEDEESEEERENSEAESVGFELPDNVAAEVQRLWKLLDAKGNGGVAKTEIDGRMDHYPRYANKFRRKGSMKSPVTADAFRDFWAVCCQEQDKDDEDADVFKALKAGTDKLEVEEKKREKAATKIQSTQRGKAGRARVAELKKSKAEEAEIAKKAPAADEQGGAGSRDGSKRSAQAERRGWSKDKDGKVKICDGFMDVKNKKKGDMRRYFVLFATDVEYYESKEEYEQGKPYRGHVANKDILKIEPHGNSFRLHTVHSKKPLDLHVAAEEDMSLWQDGWQQAVADRYAPGGVTQEDMDKAALKIQKNMRGVLGRKKHAEVKRKMLFDRKVAKKLETQQAKLAAAQTNTKLFPWKKNVFSVSKLRGMSQWREPPPNLGAPVPDGFAASLDGAQLSRDEDVRYAFKFIDSGNYGVLDRPSSHKFFRCLGWCLPPEDFDAVLDIIDVEGLSPRKQQKKPQRLRGPWTLEKLRRCNDMLMSKQNGSLASLQKSLMHLLALQKERNLLAANPQVEEINFEDVRQLIMGPEGAQFSFGDFGTLCEALYIDPESSQLSAHTLAMRCLDRVCFPQAACDVPKGLASRLDTGRDSLRSSQGSRPSLTPAP